jgi:hypothetical protein
MRYMFLIYSPENAWTPEEWTQCVATSTTICQELAAEGKLLAAAPLQPVATAMTVRVRQGTPLLTTGPFTETTEQLGGFYIVDVANLDEAIAIAARLPPARKGTVEIRPILWLDSLPPEQLKAKWLNPDSVVTCPTFMFLCYDDEAAWKAAGQDAHRAAMQEAVQLTHELNDLGQYLSASPLHPSTTATCVRLRDGRRLITDGPFAETREVLGGYYLILAPDQQAAIAVASRHPGARVGSVEVRRVIELPNAR